MIHPMHFMYLCLLLQELEESFNYGLFFPPSNGKAGKFLDEERRLCEYPFPGPIGYLEVRWMVICVSRVTNQTNDIEGDDYCYWAAPTWSWEKLLCLPTLNELPLPHGQMSSSVLAFIPTKILWQLALRLTLYDLRFSNKSCRFSHLQVSKFTSFH